MRVDMGTGTCACVCLSVCLVVWVCRNVHVKARGHARLLPGVGEAGWPVGHLLHLPVTPGRSVAAEPVFPRGIWGDNSGPGLGGELFTSQRQVVFTHSRRLLQAPCSTGNSFPECLLLPLSLSFSPRIRTDHVLGHGPNCVSETQRSKWTVLLLSCFICLF